MAKCISLYVQLVVGLGLVERIQISKQTSSGSNVCIDNVNRLLFLSTVQLVYISHWSLCNWGKTINCLIIVGRAHHNVSTVVWSPKITHNNPTAALSWHEPFVLQTGVGEYTPKCPTSGNLRVEKPGPTFHSVKTSRVTFVTQAALASSLWGPASWCVVWI